MMYSDIHRGYRAQVRQQQAPSQARIRGGSVRGMLPYFRKAVRDAKMVRTSSICLQSLMDVRRQEMKNKGVFVTVHKSAWHTAVSQRYQAVQRGTA